MTTLIAYGLTDIYTQLLAAVPGDVLEIAAWGLGALDLKRSGLGYKFAAPGITIRPATGYRPVFPAISMQACEGITWENIEISAVNDSGNLFGCPGTDRIAFRNGFIRSAVKNGTAFNATGSSDTSLWNTEIFQVGLGVGGLTNTNYTIEWVDIHGADVDSLIMFTTTGLHLNRCRAYDQHITSDGHADAFQITDCPGALIEYVDYRTGTGTPSPFNTGRPQGIFGERNDGIVVRWCAVYGADANSVSVIADSPGAKYQNCFVQGWGPDVNGRSPTGAYVVRASSDGSEITDVTGALFQIYLDDGPIHVSFNGVNTLYSSNQSFTSSFSGFTKINDTVGYDETDYLAWTANRDAVAPAALPALSSLAVADATKVEDTSSSSVIGFTVTRTGNTTIPCRARWAVTGSGGAPANAADFADNALADGLVAFDIGETSKVIYLNLASDAVVETDETFTLTLSAPYYCTLSDATATGTIANDDFPVPPDRKAGAAMTMRIFR